MTTNPDSLMPERIWAYDGQLEYPRLWENEYREDATEYIRADLCTPAIADGVGVARKVSSIIDEFYNDQDCLNYVREYVDYYLHCSRATTPDNKTGEGE